MDIVTALTTHHNVIINRDQQDAQEFFQLLSGAIDTECHRLFTTKSGIESLLSTKTSLSGVPSSPFTGLLASRLSCMQCGYTVSIHQPRWLASLLIHCSNIGGNTTLFFQQYPAHVTTCSK